MAKDLVLGTILAHAAQIRAANFFFQKSGSPITRYYGQLLPCTIAEKTNDSILRKLSDRLIDGRTEGRM